VLLEIFLTSWRSTWGRVQAWKAAKGNFRCFSFFGKTASK
jgi:hypothetical protein